MDDQLESNILDIKLKPQEIPQGLQNSIKQFSTAIQSKINESYKILNEQKIQLKNFIQQIQANKKETIINTKDKVVLEKWEKQEKEWEEITEKLSNKLRTKSVNLAMLRGSDWSEGRNIIKNIYHCYPVYLRCQGDKIWEMSLRDAWYKYIAFSDPKSGLHDCIYENSFEKNKNIKFEIIKKGNLNQEKCDFKELRKWMESDWFKNRKSFLDDYLKSQGMYENEIKALKVDGKSIEKILSKNIDNEIKFEEIENYIKNNNYELYSEIQEEKNMLLNKVDEIMDNGPNLKIERNNINFISELLNETKYEILKMENIGNTVIYYEWKNKRKILNSNIECYFTDKIKNDVFFLCDRKGVILPKQIKNFKFCFNSDKCGIFIEHWYLETNPKCVGNLKFELIIKGNCIAQQQQHNYNYNYNCNCKEINRDLKNKSKLTQVNDVIEKILYNIIDNKNKRFNNKIEEIKDDLSEFKISNYKGKYNLYYNENSVCKLKKLYNEILSNDLSEINDDENMSIETLDKMILDLMAINIKMTFYYQKKLNQIKNELIIPPSQKSIIKMAIKEILINSISNVENNILKNEENENNLFLLIKKEFCNEMNKIEILKNERKKQILKFILIEQEKIKDSKVENDCWKMFQFEKLKYQFNCND